MPSVTDWKNLKNLASGANPAGLVMNLATSKQGQKVMGGCCLAVIAAFGLMIAAVGSQSHIDNALGERPTDTVSLAESVPTGPSTCANIPEPYKTILSKKSQQGPWQVRPAFLAAIGQAESSILSRDPDGPWSNSPKGAQGPFQFIPGTWQSNGLDGGGRYYRNDQIGVPDGSKDVQSIWDAAFGATKLLANLGANGNTGDLDKLRDAAARYNSGRSWAIAQNFAETRVYVPRVINFYLKYSCNSDS